MIDIPRSARIYVAGHRGLVGSAILRRLRAEGFDNLLTATREQLDLRDQAAVNYWFRANRPEYVFLVAGTVGGILANSTRPAEFIYDNLMIHATVVHAAHLHGVRRLLYLGSSCIYPRDCPQPIREEYLLTGLLEPTNEPYAIAKIAGIKLCQAYRRQYGSRLHLGDADQPLRAARQLRPPELARAAGADAQVPRRPDGGPASEVDGLGHRHAPARVPARRRPRRRLPVPDAPLRRGRAHQRRHRRGPQHPRARRDRPRDRGPRRRLVFDPTQAGRHAAQAPRRLAACTPSGWRHRIELREGIRGTYDWFLENHGEVEQRAAARAVA